MFLSAEANSMKEHNHVYDLKEIIAVYFYYVMKIDVLFIFEAMCEVIGFVWLCVQLFKISARWYAGKPLDSDGKPLDSDIKLEIPLEERT
eukprot:16433709-Heterocapsa_arctica.AAC.1